MAVKMARMAKLVVLSGVAMLLIGGVIIGYQLVSRGALGRLNEKMNIFNMVDGSLGTMRQLNDSMTKVRTNVDTLSEKLDLLGETNGLLDAQLGVVERLNGLMAAQKPLLTTTNESVAKLEGGLKTTLGGVNDLAPVMTSLISSMGGALDVTGKVVDGTATMVSIANQISGLFDQTIGCLARIQPLSAKAKAYMRGDLLARLSQFLPTVIPASLTKAPGAPAAAPAETAANPTQADPVTTVVAPIVESTTKAVEKVTEQVVVPILDPVLDILK